MMKLMRVDEKSNMQIYDEGLRTIRSVDTKRYVDMRFCRLSKRKAKIIFFGFEMDMMFRLLYWPF